VAFFLLALALIVTSETFFLAAILPAVPILLPVSLPIVTPILAWIGCHQQFAIHGR
jgi:hypothetical protein